MRDRLVKQGAIVAACAAYAAYAVVQASGGIGTSPDSVFYLSFSPIVPTGYPVFLSLLGERGAVIVQPLVYAFALGWLGLETWRSWSSLLLALGVIGAGIAVPGLTSIHASILTESLFMSCEVMVLAAMVRFIRWPSWRMAAIAALIAGMAATLRNAGYAFVPALIVMVLVEWRRLVSSPRMVLASVVIPMLACVAGERTIAHVVNGRQATSLFGRHMFAKAALIEAPRAAPPLDPARTVIEDHLERSFAPIRQTIATAPASLRSLLTVYYETCLQGPCMREMKDQSIGALPEATQNAILGEVALQRIAHAPANFIRLTLRHYSALWTAYKQRHPDTTPILNAYFAAHRPLPFQDLAFSWRQPDQPLQFEADPRVRYVQPAVIAIAWITGALALVGLTYGAARRSPPPLLAMSTFAALTAHAGVLFSATFAPAISRFTVSFWPAVMVSLVFGLWALLPGQGKGLRPRGV